MSTLEQNIRRYEAFDNDLRSLIASKGGYIAQNTPCEDLVPIIADLIESESVEPVYGVSGLYGSSPTLTRTDDAVGLGYSVNSVTGCVSSDFNSVFPWNETAVVMLGQGKFLRLPDMYFRVGADSVGRLTDIAVSKRPVGDGKWYKVHSFDYGCYGASRQGDAIASLSGVDRMVNSTRAVFRACAANSGTGFRQLDLYHRTVMMFLWFIEFATKKSDSVMTGRIRNSGTLGGAAKCQTGGSDSVGTPSGFETSYGQMRYHYIEDFIGNVWEFVDGVSCSPAGTADYVTADAAMFSDDATGKTQLSYVSPESGCLSALGWEERNPFLCMPLSVVANTNYDTYFCDMAGNDTANRQGLYCGSSSNAAGQSNGLASFNRYRASDYSEFLGGRLIRVPNS